MLVNQFEIEKQVLGRFVAGVLPNLKPTVYMDIRQFLDCYSDNIKPYIDGGNYNIPLDKLCGVYVVEIQKFQTGELIKELEESSVIVPFFLTIEFGTTKWVRPNIDMSVEIKANIYSHYLIDPTGVLLSNLVGNFADLTYRYFIDLPFSISYGGVVYLPTQLVFNSISGLSRSLVSNSYAVRTITMTLRLLNC